MYADDTTLLFNTHDVSQSIPSINAELLKISKWLHDNHLTLNIAKTKFIIFHKKTKHVPSNFQTVVIRPSQMERTFDSRSLGLALDTCLKLDMHVQNIVKKLSKLVPVIWKVRKFLNENLLKTLYHSIVYPNIIYYASAWGGGYKTTLNPVFVA